VLAFAALVFLALCGCIHADIGNLR